MRRLEIAACLGSRYPKVDGRWRPSAESGQAIGRVLDNLHRHNPVDVEEVRPKSGAHSPCGRGRRRSKLWLRLSPKHRSELHRAKTLQKKQICCDFCGMLQALFAVWVCVTRLHCRPSHGCR